MYLFIYYFADYIWNISAKLKIRSYYCSFQFDDCFSSLSCSSVIFLHSWTMEG